jgi:hypothetical protein
MKHILLFFTALLFFSSCLQKEEYFAKYIVEIKDPISIPIEEFVTEIDTIRLEVTDESLLRGVAKMRIMDNKFYIQSDQTEILIFDLTGKYIAKVNDRGQGPNEYILITGFEIDPVNKRVIVSDNASRRVLIYDKEGNQIEVINLDFDPHIITSHKNGLLNFYFGRRVKHSNPAMENYNLHFLDSQGRFVSSAIENEVLNTVNMFTAHEINCLENGDILFHPVLGNIVYKITNDGVIPYYAFNNLSKYKLFTKRDKKRINLEYRLGSKKNPIKEAEDRGYLLTWGAVLDLTDYVYFDFAGWDKRRSLYYSKKTSKTILIEPESVRGEKSLIDIFMSQPAYASGNKFYISPSFHLINRINGNISNEKLKTFFENTDFDDSNPLIISYSINFPE